MRTWNQSLSYPVGIRLTGAQLIRPSLLVCLLVGLLQGCASGPYDSPATGVGERRQDCSESWRSGCSEARAYWVAADTIAWDGGAAGNVFTLHYSPDGKLKLGGDGPIGGEVFALKAETAGLPAAVAAKLPHLSGLRALKLDAATLAIVPALVKGQVAVQATDARGLVVDATALQLPGVLDDQFFYEGQLGVTFHGGLPMLRLWAPTARSVSLHLFDDADPATPASVLPLSGDPATGVFSLTGDASWAGKYYLFEVEVFVPSTGQVEHNLVTDPYSLSLSANSGRSQIVDLAAPELMPPGWGMLAKPPLAQPADISIYELHVRDFSIADKSVPAESRGTFSAFTQPESNGMRHLRALADAGVSHLHLLPVFDIATVPERRGEQRSVALERLLALPADSDRQQAMIEEIKEEDGFNWGYDPWHYTVPEGSYAVEPGGGARIREFRAMVKALNEAGLNVVMDVVYNHTSAAGQHHKSVLDRIVPGYYQRLNARGELETSTCCANTATEHAMMEKLMIDSVLTWARDYKVDGFRFDLMGHHSKASMLRLRDALDALTVETDGVDGGRIYLYGEGWNFGEVEDDARFEQATQANMAGTGIGTFNDRLRDGARGGTPFIDPREQGFINGLGYDPNAWEFTNGDDDLAELRHITDWIRVGLSGGLASYRFENAEGNMVSGADIDYLGDPAGYTARPQELISYVAAHDNETLFDIIQMKAPAGAGMDERVRMQNMANSLVALGQGLPFFHAGQDILRSKSMDRDSFNSGDWFNEIDWTLATGNWARGLPIAEKNEDKWPLMKPLLADKTLVPGEGDREFARRYFLELLKIRKSSRLFRMDDAELIKKGLAFHNTGPEQVPGLIVMTLSDHDGDLDPRWTKIVVLFNANDEQISFALDGAGGEDFKLHPAQATSVDAAVRGAHFNPGDGVFRVPARTTAVFVR